MQLMTLIIFKITFKLLTFLFYSSFIHEAHIYFLQHICRNPNPYSGCIRWFKLLNETQKLAQNETQKLAINKLTQHQTIGSKQANPRTLWILPTCNKEGKCNSSAFNITQQAYQINVKKLLKLAHNYLSGSRFKFPNKV